MWYEVSFSNSDVMQIGSSELKMPEDTVNIGAQNNNFIVFVWRNK